LRYKGVTYGVYPELLDAPPPLPSPWRAADGREYVAVFTKEGKSGLVDVTEEDCERKGRQLLVDEADFPALARTGLHSDAELERTRRITGRPVEEITVLGLPGALSTDGFFRPGEDIVSVLEADNRLVRELGLTHPQLARPLLHVWNLILTDTRLGRWNMARHRWESVQAVFYNDKKVLLDAGDTRGGQRSIFDDEITGAFHIEIKRSPDGEEARNGVLRCIHAVRDALHRVRSALFQCLWDWLLCLQRGTRQAGRSEVDFSTVSPPSSPGFCYFNGLGGVR
jgi:hypothetical protein